MSFLIAIVRLLRLYYGPTHKIPDSPAAPLFYAELAGMVPVAGSPYLGYAVLSKLADIGWDLLRYWLIVSSDKLH